MSRESSLPFINQTVWITGAGSGIGKAAAQMFAQGGANIALIGRRPEALQAVLEGISPQGGGEMMALPLDVSDRQAVERATAELLERWGRVDILVNSAGLNIPQRRLHNLQPGNWDQVIQVNLTGAYNMVAAVLPPMRAQAGGLIINVSSMAAKGGSGLSGAAYTASKHGMNGLTYAINAEESAHGIRATALCPGEVNTELLEKRPVAVPQADRERMIAPEDLADTIRFLALLPARTTVTEMLVVPTHKRKFQAGETG